MSWAVSGRSGHRTCIPKTPTPVWHTGVLMAYVIWVFKRDNQRPSEGWSSKLNKDHPSTAFQTTWPLSRQGYKRLFFWKMPFIIWLHTDWKAHHLTEVSDTHPKQENVFRYYLSLQNIPCLLNWRTVIQSWERTESIMGRHIFTSLTPLHLFLAISVKFWTKPGGFLARKWEARDISILTRAIQHTHYGSNGRKINLPFSHSYTLHTTHNAMWRPTLERR